MDKLKKKKKLIVMVGLAIVAGVALCYITDWANGKPEHPANYQCEEKQCAKKPTDEKPTNGAGGQVSFFGIKVPVNYVIGAVIVFFIVMAVLFCYAWYTQNWRLTLFLFVLFFLFCIFMRQFLPSG